MQPLGNQRAVFFKEPVMGNVSLRGKCTKWATCSMFLIRTKVIWCKAHEQQLQAIRLKGRTVPYDAFHRTSKIQCTNRENVQTSSSKISVTVRAEPFGKKYVIAICLTDIAIQLTIFEQTIIIASLFSFYMKKSFSPGHLCSPAILNSEWHIFSLRQILLLLLFGYCTSPYCPFDKVQIDCLELINVNWQHCCPQSWILY